MDDSRQEKALGLEIRHSRSSTCFTYIKLLFPLPSPHERCSDACLYLLHLGSSVGESETQGQPKLRKEFKDNLDYISSCIKEKRVGKVEK